VVPLVVTQPYVGETVVVAQVLWTVTVITNTSPRSADGTRLSSHCANTLSLNRREECCTQQRTQGASGPHLSRSRWRFDLNGVICQRKAKRYFTIVAIYSR
jgi:hypothetical protein